MFWFARPRREHSTQHNTYLFSILVEKPDHVPVNKHALYARLAQESDTQIHFTLAAYSAAAHP